MRFEDYFMAIMFKKDILYSKIIPINHFILKVRMNFDIQKVFYFYDTIGYI